MKVAPLAMGAAVPALGRLYIAVREDLPVGLQMAQAVHAGFSYAQGHPEAATSWLEDSQYLVIVGVPNEDALGSLVAEARMRKIPHAAWHEPDLLHPLDAHHELTAAAFAPVPESRRLCANLPLAGKQAHQSRGDAECGAR